MEIVLYQINEERDYNECEFMDYNYTQQFGIDPFSYDRVWSGHLEATTLDGVYNALNQDIRPDNYNGRSMSVSDICEVVRENRESRFYFVDSSGFTEVEFDPSLTREAKEREITVLRCQPGKTAEVVTIPNTLKSLQSEVGGYIEAVYPSSDPVALIVNEEGKIHGLPLNRALYTEDGQMYDIAAGPMLVVGLTEDDFGSLRGDLLEKYTEKFKHPERFMQFGDQIMAFKIPGQQQKEDRTQKHHIRR
jgi:hypothetical protein